MHVDIWVALIGLGGVIYASTIGLFFSYVKKLNAQHQEKILEAADLAKKKADEDARRSFYLQVTSPYYPIKDWTRFTNHVKKVHEKTQIDRVLILVAVNGITTPTHASVVWEFRSYGDDYAYVDVPLDKDYVDRLMVIRSGKFLRFKTEEADNTLIGEFYKAEGVTESVWAMIGKRTSFYTDQVAYKYISVATHDDSGFKDARDIERTVGEIVAEFRPMLPTSGFGPI